MKPKHLKLFLLQFVQGQIIFWLNVCKLCNGYLIKRDFHVHDYYIDINYGRFKIIYCHKCISTKPIDINHVELSNIIENMQ